MRLLLVLKVARNIFLAILVAVLSVGISTLFWPTVQGQVKENIFNKVKGEGYQTARYVKIGGSFTEQKVTYQYRFEGASYTSTLICICIPVAVIEPMKFNETIKVYVFPLAPQISVMHAGPDLWLVVLLGLAAFSFGYLRLVLVRSYKIGKEHA